jgi:cob(I)alamin adenosyltransferase
MGHRLTKIYTRTGDKGTTSLDGKTRLLKNALRIEAVGTIDELNCTIGLVVTQPIIPQEIQAFLTQVQHELFDLGGELCPPHRVAITSEHVLRLEQIIDHWNADLPPLKEFILPRGTPAAATCHLARAVCRRAERCLVALAQEETLSEEILRYINRLSDVLFVGARMLGKDEILWDHDRKK